MKELDFQTIFKKLNELGIDYLLVGGLAVNFYGVPRMTYDIDIMISLQKENIQKVINQLTHWGFKPKLPVNPHDLEIETKRNEWIKDKHMRAFNFYNEEVAIREIDIVLDVQASYQTLKNRAVNFTLHEVNIPTISIQDLIELKRSSGRKQDISDVEHLKIILDK